ncbi:MAG: NPCBM/NEW2 domain-containing protein [Pseudonocardia sp.]
MTQTASREPTEELNSSTTESPTDRRTKTSSLPPPGATTYLDSLDPVGRDYLKSEPRRVDNNSYAHALYDSLGGCYSTGPAEYVVPEGAQTFTVVVGLADSSPTSEAKVKFTFYIDGRIPQNGEAEVGLKETVTIKFSVKDALRLKLEATLVEGDVSDNCNSEAVAVWGDPRLAW